MKLTSRIARRHLSSRHRFSFISFSTILSIIGLAIGIASLIIIASITNGFNIEVNTKLSSIDGHLRIENYIDDKISIKDTSVILSSLRHINEITSISPFIEKHVIARKGNISEGLLVYGIPEYSLESIFNIKQFTHSVSSFPYDNSIIIGRKLADMFGIGIGDELILFNVNSSNDKNILKAKKFIISNVFKTDFPEYDRMLVFINFNIAQKYFQMNDFFSGLIINVQNPEDIYLSASSISEKIGHYPYMTISWQDRHESLLEWLKIYDIPIKMIIIFIILIGVFNIAASLWMIVIEKNKDYAILKTLGLSNKQIQIIIIKEGLIIGLLGGLLGIIISVTLLFMQIKFNLISLPNDIYFMEHLPVNANISYFIIYPLLSIIITLFCSYAPSIMAMRISPSEVLKYE